MSRIDIEKAWEIGRELVVHEDKLTYDRLRTLLTLNGFLVAAISLVIKELKDKSIYDLPTAVVLFIGFVALFGVLSSIPFLRADILSSRFRRSISNWWTRSIDQCREWEKPHGKDSDNVSTLRADFPQAKFPINEDGTEEQYVIRGESRLLLQNAPRVIGKTWAVPLLLIVFWGAVLLVSAGLLTLAAYAATCGIDRPFYEVMI